MREHIGWFSQVLTAAIQLYFRQGCELESIEDVQPPHDGWLEQVTGQPDIRFEERVVVMLALMPHVCPQALDIFFVQNKDFDRQYTEFGGWKGLSHGGFLPTGETASFILAGDDVERRGDVLRLFGREHWFYRRDILRLEGAGEGEPLLSGQLRVSDGFLSRVLLGEEYKPDYSTGFPAKRVTTELEWKDLVLDYRVSAELEEINTWIASHKTVMEDWGLSRYLKAGYRALFYGPPGTGKTLAATLLGKKNKMDVYRVDLSMIVSKYIGETEKNLARVFDMAENRNWILFFDEADALSPPTSARILTRHSRAASSRSSIFRCPPRNCAVNCGGTCCRRSGWAGRPTGSSPSLPRLNFPVAPSPTWCAAAPYNLSCPDGRRWTKGR